jgi:two-component system sensor histidine kinase PilS (NtrC family)
MSAVPATDPAVNAAASSEAAVVAQNWKLLQQFNFYRLALAVAFFAVALIPDAPVVDPAQQSLVRLTAFVYAALGAAAFWTIRRKHPEFDEQASLLAFADVVLIAMLMHGTGGIGGGLGLLMVVAVAECSVLLSRRMTVFYASLGAIAALIEHSWPLLTGRFFEFPALIEGYPRIGLLGMGLFLTGTLGNTLATRLRSTAALAERQEIDLANLANINELIIDRMQAGVLVCDTRGNIQMLNRAARDFLGIGDSAAGHLNLEQISPELGAELKDWRHRGFRPQRQVVRTITGANILPRFVALGDRGQDLGYLVFLDDTELLRQQAQQLKMAALARLTGSIAHEIRNPLAAVTNASQLLRESVDSSPETQRLLTIIDNHSKRMNIIVENITQLGRRDRSRPMRLQLDDWLSDFVYQFSQGTELPPEYFIIEAGTAPADICFDPDQLYQVMANLCTNAIKHSPAYDGQPRVTLRIGTDAQGHPVLDIADQGAGVPEDLLPSIFDPFFTTTPQGTGLGLYISRELCEGNGGRLDYISGDTAGATFRITFARGEECGA